MNIRMRSGAAEVNGEMKRMSLSAVKVNVGDVYQTMRGEWKIVATEYGAFEIEDDQMFGYETRAATPEEVARWTQPQPRSAIDDFFSDFSDATDYIR